MPKRVQEFREAASRCVFCIETLHDDRKMTAAERDKARAILFALCGFVACAVEGRTKPDIPDIESYFAEIKDG